MRTALGGLHFFFSSRRRHTRSDRDWSSDVCSSDLLANQLASTTKTPVTISLAGAATFGALAYLVGVIVPAAIQPPFPILPYLKFDPAEIMDVSSLLIFGPIVGIVTATIHFLILTATSPDGNPFGPSLKYLGVLSTYGGIIAASRFGRHNLV